MCALITQLCMAVDVCEQLSVQSEAAQFCIHLWVPAQREIQSPRKLNTSAADSAPFTPCVKIRKKKKKGERRKK